MKVSFQHPWRPSAVADCDAMLRPESRPNRKGKSDGALARASSMMCALLATCATLAFFFAAVPEDASSAPNVEPLAIVAGAVPAQGTDG